MPSANSCNLTLTTVNNNVTVLVSYKAEFTPFERFLATHGMQFQERISIIGADPSGATTGTVLRTFFIQNLPVTNGSVNQIIPRSRSMTVSRDVLQEDKAGDNQENINDEIVCRIEIRAIGLPSNITSFTDQEVLLG